MTTLEKFMRFLAEKNYYISEEMVDYYWELRAEDDALTSKLLDAQNKQNMSDKREVYY